MFMDVAVLLIFESVILSLRYFLIISRVIFCLYTYPISYDFKLSS